MLGRLHGGGIMKNWTSHIHSLLTLFTFPLTLGLMAGCGGSSNPSYSLLPDSNEFQQSAREVNSKIDILWVIDNSGSMANSQTNLANNFAAFIQQFASKGYDFQIAVTTTEAWVDYYNSSVNYSRYRMGSATQVGNYRILNPATPNLQTEFIANIKQGINGTGDERAFSSLKKALTNTANITDGFPRPDAFLSVIIVSDEDDNSRNSSNMTGGTLDSVDSYMTFLNTYTNSISGGAKKFSVNAIAIWDQACLTSLQDSSQKISTRYKQLVDLSGGISASICGNFATSLANISSSIIELSTIFYLDRVPLEETIRVTVNGVAVQKNNINGWVYLADKNAIQFKGSAVPAQGARVSVDFDPVTIKQ